MSRFRLRRPSDSAELTLLRPNSKRWLSATGLFLAIATVPFVAIGSTSWGDFRDIYLLDISQGEPLELSTYSGFYSGRVSVEVVDPGQATIFYTLDGSFPDIGLNPDSTRIYSGPIVIDRDTTALSASLFDYVLSDTGLPVPSPNKVTETATVLRIRADDGPETVATYFVDSYQDMALPVTSLIVEPEYLFDQEKGIYVAGKKWEDLVASGKPLDEILDMELDDVVNFFGQTDNWERPFPGSPENPVWLDWTRGIDEEWVATQAGIRIHGRTNRKDPQKSLRLYAREEYGSTRFSQDFFPNNDVGYSKRIIIRTGGNDDSGSKLRDSYLQALGENLKVEIQRSQPTAVFINGEYWGLYFVRDRYDDRFFEQFYGVNTSSVSIVDHELLVQEGPADSAEPLRELFLNLLDLPLGSAEAVEQISKQIDVESLFDYIAIETFASNNDWPRNNVLMWKTSDPSRDPMARGHLWRYMLKDLDHGAPEPAAVEIDTVSAIVDLPEPYLAREDAGIRLMMRHLLNYPESRQQFFTRYRELLDSEFATDTTLPLLDSMALEIAPEVARDRQRWEGIPEEDSARALAVWQSDVEGLRQFMAKRVEELPAMLDRFEADLSHGAYASWPEGIRRD